MATYAVNRTGATTDPRAPQRLTMRRYLVETRAVARSRLLVTGLLAIVLSFLSPVGAQAFPTPFSSSSTNCLEQSGTTFISTAQWVVSGERLQRVRVESDCLATYTFVTLDFEVNFVVAPGASAIWGPSELRLFGKFHEPSVHVAQGTDIPGAATPCVYTAIAEIDYLLEADGTLVPDPCPAAAP